MSIDNTNFFSYIYSSWLTKYLWKAYRKGLSLTDIPDISPLDSCSCNIQKFENLWNEEFRQRGPTSASLPLVAWRFVRFRFITACILNACSQIVNFILQTLLLRKLLEYSENPESNFFSGMHWVIYIIAFDLLQMILYTWSGIMNQRTALRLKSACLSLLFKKVINMNNIAHRSNDELMSILSKDGDKIYDAVNFGTLIVNGPVVTICVVICISMWLSPSAILGVIIFLMFYILQFWLIHLINYCKENASEYTRERIQKTMEVLSHIRQIKINGWEQHFLQNISNIRNRESKWLWKLSYVFSLNSATAHAIPIIAIVVTFYMHFTVSRNLTASVAFPVCVVIIVQLHGAFGAMKTSLSHLKQSLLIFNKVKSGLLLDDTSCHITKPYEASQAVAIVNASFAYDIYKKQNNNTDIVEDIKKSYVNDKSIIVSEKQTLKPMLREYEPQRIEILKNITLKAKKGQLIGISGSSKSGKSSLLLAALGQIRLINGQLMRQGSCAYVAQKSWLINGSTIKDNILFGEPYDAKRYYEAQIVCKLRQEMKRLPDGDETEIGERCFEISNSLGQKIALARAFYADRDIYFLDDSLNSIEDDIREVIFEDLIVRALAEKTILFVTRELKYLDKCDYMYIMRDGTIAEHGKHKELMRLGKEYAAMVRTAISDAEGDYNNEFYDAQDTGITKEFELSNEDDDTVLNSDLELQNSDRSSNTEDQSEPDETRATTYCAYAKSVGGFFILFGIIVVYVIYAAVGVLSILRLTWWIDAVNGKYFVMPLNVLSEDFNLNELSIFAFYKNWFGSCFFLVIIACIIQSFVMQFATTKIADNLHDALLSKLIHAPLKLIDASSCKKVRNLLLHDLGNVSLSLPYKLDNTLRYFAIGFCTFFVLISTIPWFTNYVVFTTVFFFYIGKLYRVAQLNFKDIENTVRLSTNSFLQNSIQGLSTIRTFKKENDLMSKFQNLVDQNNACYFIKGVSEKWLSIRLQVLTSTCLFVAATLVVVMKEEISPAVAGLTFVYIWQVPNIIQMGLKYYSKTETCFINVQHICDYIEALVGENANTTAAIVPGADWPMTGTIKFDNVHLRHCSDEQVVLDHVTFTINNKEKIGVLDLKTNSSKSALVAAIYRLYELSGGKIFIDGIDVSKIDIKLLRKQLPIIPQDPIFYGTIRFFLDPTKCHDDSEIWSALEKVHMKNRIAALASQLYYSTDGKKFNILEKQLLFVARAFLNYNKILILEENSTIDRQSTMLVEQVMENEFKESTVLIVTQRLRTILSCNRVLIMDNGRVLEFDKPSILMADKNSHLKKLMTEDDEISERI